jgi:transposase-like protein
VKQARLSSRSKSNGAGLFPSAVQVIENDLDALWTFFQFDPTYWMVLRTTNPIKGLNKEFKRSTRATDVTGGEISTYRCLVYVSQTRQCGIKCVKGPGKERRLKAPEVI